MRKYLNYAVVSFMATFTLICGMAVADPLPIFPWLAPPTVEKTLDVAKKCDCATIYGEIDDKMAHDVVEAIEHANTSSPSTAPIMLYINSPGGSILAGGLIIDTMTASRRPVWTVCVELCASMGAITHQYGVKRFMLKHSVLMFHEASSAAQGYVTHLASRTAFWTVLFGGYEAYVAHRAGMTVEALRAHEAAEWWVMVDEATAMHLNDDVRTASNFPAPKE